MSDTLSLSHPAIADLPLHWAARYNSWICRRHSRPKADALYCSARPDRKGSARSKQRRFAEAPSANIELALEFSLGEIARSEVEFG